MNEWRRVERSGLYGPEFTAYVNDRFKKLYPGHDVSHLTPGAPEAHAG